MPSDLILVEDYAMLCDVMQSLSFISVIFNDGLTCKPWGQPGVPGSHLLHVGLCTQISKDRVISHGAIHYGFEAQSARLILPFDVGFGHVLVSAASQYMTSRVFKGA